MSVHEFEMKKINGEMEPLSKYKGKLTLIVNVASECGLTPQYKGLQELYETFKDRDFTILGFPANEFGAQEPGSDKEIESFCSLNYGVTFPMFSKIIVKGEGIHPLYQYLTGKETNPEGHGEIAWNFQKYLVGKNGEIIKTYHPKTEPLDAELIADIEANV
jgi:glutathione peroxidase